MTMSGPGLDGLASPLDDPARGAPRLSVGWQRFRTHRFAVVGLAVVALLVLAAVLAPVMTALGILADPNRIDVRGINAGISGHHLLGADSLGRDLLARSVYGTRVSLSVGIVVQLVVLAVGGTIGLVAGYVGGRVDSLLMRLTDVMFAFPDLLFVLLVAAILGPGFWHIFLAVGAVSWAYLSRLVRGLTRSVRGEPYIEAARAAGRRPASVILRHVLPNIAGPVVVAVTFAVPGGIFIEAFLSFVGVGIRPPTASWGVMINDGYQVIFAHPMQVLAPALAISLATMAFTFLGDGLRDSLDPRTTAPGRRAQNRPHGIHDRRGIRRSIRIKRVDVDAYLDRVKVQPGELHQQGGGGPEDP